MPSVTRPAIVVALLALLLASDGLALPDVRPTVGKRVALASFDGSLSGWRGYNASLTLVSGASGGSAARVSLAGSSTSFSIYPSPRQVTSTVAGVRYVATAVVRSLRPGREVCLRIREWAGSTLAGSAKSCMTATSDWTALPKVPYTVLGSGRSLDAYVYQWKSFAGDSFDVDSIALTIPGITAPAPAPAPAPGALTATAVDHAHIALTWPAVAGAATYRVRRGALVVGVTPVTSFTDVLLWPSTRYDYVVDALAGDGSALSSSSVAGTTAALPATGFPRPFAADSFWNTPVGGRATHARNTELSAYFRSKVVNPNLTLGRWAVAVAEVHPSDPLHTIPCTKYACTLGAFGQVPMPVTAVPDPAGDGHLAVIDPAAGREWGMWQATKATGSWTASAGAAVSLAVDGLAPAGTASGNAANFPLLGGLIRPEEILQGRIDHALVFGLPGIGQGPPVCPATHNAPTTSDPNALREGQLLQLDPALDVSALALPAWQKTIARAAQTYGMYLRDNSGSLALYAENPVARGYDAWTSVGLGGLDSASLAAFPWDRFRVVGAPDC